MSTFTIAAARILAPLSAENEVRLEKNKVLKTFTTQMTAHTLTAYAEAACVIAGMIAEGTWTARKQAGGVKSASLMLKAAIVAEAAARELNEAKAKRLVEKSAAILTKKNLAIPGFAEAARDNDPAAVVAALDAFKIRTEAALVKHVDGKREADPVDRILTMIEALDEAQRARFDAAIAKPAKAAKVPAMRVPGAGKGAEAAVLHSAA